MKLLSLADVIVENQLYEQLLLEANVANVKLPIGSELSILSYLQKYAEGIATPEAKQAFVKKLSGFLMNDARNLHALREVPADAPDWAKQAAQTGELMLFVPDATLNDKIEHVVHYLAAAEADAQQTANNDQKVFATGELKGFGKAESLDLLVAKSNDYFKRGARSQKRDQSGMKQTMDCGDGYIWYQLVEAAAYQREGKLLQNCIGSHYTPAKAGNEDTIIFILRDPTDNSVCAARVVRKGDAYELQEVKGKQNKPPVDKYMVPTIKFLNKMKFVIGTAADRDLSNAGYFYIEGEFYNLPTAIQKFTNAKEITELPSGGKVVRVTSENPELMSRAYPGSSDHLIYELRDKSGDPQFCFYVKNHVLDKVKSSKNKEEDSNNYYNRITHTISSDISSAIRNEMFTVLMNKDLISEINPALRKQLFWNEKSTYNTATKKFGTVTPDKEHQISPEDHKWDEYSSPGIVGEVSKVMSNGNRDFNMKPGDIKQIFVMHGNKNKKFVFAVTKQNEAVPGVVENGEFTKELTSYGYEGSSYSPTGRERKDLKSLVNFANDKKLKLPSDIMKNHGIVRNEDGTYEQYSMSGKEVLSSPKVTMYDLSGLTGENKAVAFNFMTDEPELKQASEQNYKRGAFRKGLGNSKYNSDPLESTQVKEVDKIYKVDITYGVDKPHKFLMTVKGNTITHLDDDTKDQKWQNWDDFDKVATTINDVKTKLKLNLSSSAATGSEEFKVVNGDLSTKSHDIKQRLDKKRLQGRAGNETVTELPYSDGAKLVKMDAAQQAGWMRQGLGVTNLKGEVWKLVRADGTIPFAYFVDNGKIVRTLTQGWRQRNDQDKGKLPTEKAYNQESLKYLKAASDAFGWKAAMPTLMISAKEEDVTKTALKNLIAHSSKNGSDDSKLFPVQEIHKEPGMQRLIRFGLAKRVYKEDSDDEFTHTYWVEPTKAGIEAWNKLQKGETVDGLAQITAKPLSDKFKMPEKEKEPEHVPLARAAERPRDPVRGERTKAAMAVDKFREMQAANGRIPTLAEFKRVLTVAPFNMSELAAQTYYYATKKRIAAPIGEGFYNLHFGNATFSLMKEVARSMRE